MKNTFCMIIIVKSWPIKFVMNEDSSNGKKCHLDFDNNNAQNVLT
jgi:hypothetical protein